MELPFSLPVRARRDFGYATHVLAGRPVAAADMNTILGSHLILRPTDPNSKAIALCAHDDPLSDPTPFRAPHIS